MCGICGIVNTIGEAVSPVHLERMTAALAHRGPDGEGTYADRNVGLGHRRLAIIDLSPAGNQPMITPDERYAIAYNGEVYNFKQLRLKLESLGHQFRSRTDSEVVLHSFIEWREKCVDMFNGMFAFAIFDNEKKQLFLARDRYGIKPLYYAYCGGVFLFASEQKSILAHPAARREIDLEAVLEYFTFQNILTDKTLLKGIKTFPPGSFATLSTNNGNGDLSIHKYWDYAFVEPEKAFSENEYLEELQRLFNQAVSRQLISDVDLGAYLSGGMDSGSITAVASQQLPYIKTFTCGFDLHSASGLEVGFDERQKSEYMSYLFKTEHYEMVLKAGDMERILPDLAWHLEEPRVGQSYPNYYVAQLAGKFVKVVLAGTGGDEMFGGYPWRYYRAAVNHDFDDYIDKYYLFWQRLIPNKAIHEVFKPVWSEVKHVWTRDIFKSVFSQQEGMICTPAEYINHSMYFEAKTFLHGLLIVEDKLSMAHGLETRVPFLDNDIVDFAMQLPLQYKLGNIGEIIRLNENEPGPKSQKYFQKTKDGKLLLRKAMEKFIPRTITDAVKQGFSAPDASWFKGDSIEFVKQILHDKHAKIYSILDKDAVLSLVKEHLEGKNNRRLFIWSLLNFEFFCRKYL